MTPSNGRFITDLNRIVSMKSSQEFTSLQLQPLPGQETVHLNIVPPSVRGAILIWGLSVHSSNTIPARSSHQFMSHYIGCPTNTQPPPAKTKVTHLMACPQRFTRFPLILLIPLYNGLRTLLMLEIEVLYTYETSQPTNACILFSFSTGARSRAYHDVNNESPQRKL